MGQWHFLELSAIEGLVGKKCDVVVHASLSCEHEDHIGIVVVAAQQTLEERQTAVGEVNGAKAFVADSRDIRRLLHHRRQLLVVTNHHEFADGGSATASRAEYSEQMRLKD